MPPRWSAIRNVREICDERMGAVRRGNVASAEARFRASRRRLKRSP
jgi:predicted metal-dependent hydrolase